MAQTCYQRKIRRNGPSIWVCLVNISSCQFVTCHKFAAANCLHGCCLHNHSCWSSSCPMLVHCAQTAQQITAQKPGVPPSSSVCHPADTAADPHHAAMSRPFELGVPPTSGVCHLAETAADPPCCHLPCSDCTAIVVANQAS